MASWKKIIVSGRQADLAAVSASAGIVGTIQTAAQTNITSLGTLASIDVDGGAIDGAVIGANDAVAGTFTTATANTSIVTPKIGHSSDANLIQLSNDTVTIGTGDTLKTNTILETTTDSGVNVEGVLFKDNNIQGIATTLNIGPSNDADTLVLTSNTVTVNGTLAATTVTGDGSGLTGIAAFLSMSADSGTADGVELKTDTVHFTGDGDTITAVSDNSMSINLNSTLTGVSQISNDGLTLQRADGNDKIDFAANDIIVTVGGSEVASFEDDKVVFSQPLNITSAGTGLDVDNNVNVDGDIVGDKNLSIANISASAGAAILGTERTAENGRDVGLFVENDISASGLQAEFFEITSSVLITSESTAFGNDLTDTHIFSGSINLTGSSDVILDVGASNFIVAGVSKTNPNGTFTGSFSGDGSSLDLASNTSINQNAFSTVAVSGQSDAVASGGSTLTLASQSDGLNITTNAATDTITFDLVSIPNTSLANSTIGVAGQTLSLGQSISSTAILNGTSVFSSSAQLPDNIISSSEQLPANIVSSSTQVDFDELKDLPSGLVSGSSQVTYSDLNGIPSNIISGSAEGSAQGQITLNGQAVNVNALGTTDNPTFNNLTVQNLTVEGTTTTIDVTELRVDDNFILLNSGSTTSNNEIDSGITVNGAGAGFESLYWDATAGRWSIAGHSSEVTNNASDGLVGKHHITTVSQSSVSPTGVPTYGESADGNATRVGEMVVQTGDDANGEDGDIWIYS